MNAAPFVGPSRAADWTRKAAIFLPAQGFRPVRRHHDFGDSLRGPAVYRARAYGGQRRDGGGHQDTVRRAADGGPAPVQDVRVDHGGPHVLMAQELLDRPDVVPGKVPWKGIGHLWTCKWLILRDHGRPAGLPRRAP